MSNSQPAGSRLLQDLLSRVSPGTQSMLSSSYLKSTPVQVPDTVPQFSPDFDVDDNTKLALFDQILDDVEQTTPAPVAESIPAAELTAEPALEPAILPEPTIPTEPSVLSQAVPLAVVQQEADQVQEQVQQIGGKKESLEGTGFGVATTELPGGMSYAEQEPVPEISPEVESYMSHVEKQAEIQSDTFVVAQDVVPDATQPAQPPRIVKVLPITKEQEAVGMKKNPSFSVRWLVEFGHKIAKMFAGDVVYRE